MKIYSRWCCGKWRYIYFPNRLHSQFNVDFYEIVCMTSGTMSLKAFWLSCQKPPPIIISYHTDTLTDGSDFSQHVSWCWECVSSKMRIVYNLTFCLYASYFFNFIHVLFFVEKETLPWKKCFWNRLRQRMFLSQRHYTCGCKLSD